MRFSPIILLSLLPFVWAGAQERGNWVLQIEATDFDWDEHVPKYFADSLTVVKYLAAWRERSRERAYWEASVDSLYATDSLALTGVLHRGPAYSWSKLELAATPTIERWARRAGYRERRFGNGRRLSPGAWTTVRDSLISRAATDGYPFASAALTDIEWAAPGQLTAKVDVRTGPLVRIGSLRIPENVRVRNIFLERYLGLLPGEPYSQRRVRRLRERLAQLPYLSLQGAPIVSFRDSLAYIDLPLERQPASRFDFVIGVLPNSNQTGKLLITGELNGELYNGFGQGERIAARFEQLKPQTQELQLGLDYPFLFGLPFGFEGELELYRRDTSFLNLNWHLAATYLREGNDRLSAFWEKRSTIVPGLDSTRLVNGQLPDTLGVSRSFFGLQLRRNRTDRRFSPRNGYTVDISGAAGFRRLKNLDFAGEVADSLSRRSAQFQLAAAVDLYFDPLVGTVLYLGLRAQALLTERDVLANEQYRIGGARILRGFDEQQIFATDYQVLTAEFRLLLGERAFLYAFADAARVNSRSSARPNLAIDYPRGFGAGVNFETRAGIFGLSLALGARRGLPVDLGAPKVHLGYVSVF
ncbi:outer membrane protein assembly factor BamA [Lewinella aquimaris]|uniref:Outer membrane protein assembly factor BamA n=1 Tax=Neolewinella aquimaris TaxID=1835722 RepID=A0A840E8B0_9BACT|nr:BamA/TamA family outer membrane protein [Neolewinella aquimaris]MBB4080163.1 outer membrane protein assembly factor BamA [Neolewinella aquimaris]